jgi:hypothetical protein
MIFVFHNSLRSFATDWRKVRQEKEDMVRKRIANERALLIQNGSPSPALLNILEQIFCSYHTSDDLLQGGNVNVSLPYTMAARLWYRCGLKIAKLDSLFEEGKCQSLSFKEFVDVIEKVIAEDEEMTYNEKSETDPSKIDFEVRVMLDALKISPFSLPAQIHLIFLGRR